MTATILVTAASFLLVITFALFFGGQMFDTSVNEPVFFADPPASIATFLTYPVAPRVPMYFTRLIGLMMFAGTFGLFVWIAEAGPLALIVSVGCSLLYLAMLFLFFIPANRKLGFLPAPGGAASLEPSAKIRLAQHWRMLNRIRIFVHFVGLAAAVFAVAAAMP